MYFCRIISKASPISLGYSGLGSWLERREAEVCTGLRALLPKVVDPAIIAAALLGPAPPVCTAFLSISFSRVNKYMEPLRFTCAVWE